MCVRVCHRPVIEAAVDNGVVHGGAHCQPHDGQVDLLDERFLEHVRKELVQQKVDVERQPADGERTHHHDHHLHHLSDTEQHLFRHVFHHYSRPVLLFFVVF